MAHLSSVHTFVSGFRVLAAGLRLYSPAGAATFGPAPGSDRLRLQLSNFKELIEGGLMILSGKGPGMTRNASDYYNYSTRMPDAARQLLAWF